MITPFHTRARPTDRPGRAGSFPDKTQTADASVLYCLDMSLPSAYLTSTRNTAGILGALQKAAVPETFTYEFLKQLGYASSSDRPMISVMKALGLLDAGGRPTSRYRDYKDPALSRSVLATSLRTAYKDVFAIDTDAHTRSINELNGMFSRLSDKGTSVTTKMASTFKTLADLADFSTAMVGSVEPEFVGELELDDAGEATSSSTQQKFEAHPGQISLRHDIHVHLPLSTDVAVYDAIFKSLKAHLT
ncbi:DUF5343 domain-containing protein [Cellulomonas rhizosphaerae]|uniref:DUF5343 domain-containing protein n=1 Tax=Cellulomonas rhizosphaerae TaxID=2293719 RepID=A0A413RJY4_9CELL|nr:DUF5343 domain-containing protein [Cellulomonas rhizosphaerae]RHA39002.1 hypothetical protein D1825_12695 [Cellulomonas rhizosphaerae]